MTTPPRQSQFTKWDASGVRRKKKILCRVRWSCRLPLQVCSVQRNMVVAICPVLRFLSPLLSHIVVYCDLISETLPYSHSIWDSCWNFASFVRVSFVRRRRICLLSYFCYKVILNCSVGTSEITSFQCIITMKII